MIPAAVHSLIAHARGKPDQGALNDRTAVFWVDWREDPFNIPVLCEAVIRSGTLGSEEEGDAPFVVWRGKRTPIPVTGTDEDPHPAVLALNNVLKPDYEIRFVRQCVGGDSAAFVALTSADWRALEERYGSSKVSDTFTVVAERPNVFTETPRPPSRWKFW
jgi:hypothetical protein